MTVSREKFGLFVTFVWLSIAVRIAVGFWPFSGENWPPKFGDFEAQRHWKEITLNLPLSEWYTFDKEYWGLDYPPLTAYHEFAMAKIGSRLLGEAPFALNTSRGFESVELRQFMRYSVIVTDLTVFYSAVAFLFFKCPQFSEDRRLTVASSLLFAPTLISVDHGHFQYNCAALGFFLWAVFMILNSRYLLATVFFCCAVLFKQTLLYFSPVFFFYLLGICRQRPLFLKLVFTVIATFCVILFPFSFDKLRFILSSIFPLHRGVFEDYVANFWILASPVLKLRRPDRLLEISSVMRLSTLFTLGSFAECSWGLVNHPQTDNFLISLAHCSLGFFLFSWQVHEKAICLPLTAFSLIGLTQWNQPGYNALKSGFPLVAFFSMLRLYEKDSLVVPAILLHSALLTFDSNVITFMTILIGSILGFVLPAFVAPPVSLPFLWSFGLHAFCAICFIFTWRVLLKLRS